jgi:hypothetical protein
MPLTYSIVPRYIEVRALSVSCEYEIHSKRNVLVLI